MLTPLGVSALETAAGAPFGNENGSTPPARSSAPPAAALEEALLPALHRPPCLVSFSGGRDSSVLLATAVAAARRGGFPAPVPVTLRFPHAPRAEETSWQERVVAHLGLDDWVRIEMTDELDFVGPVAREVLSEHGPLYPPNAHLVAPMLARAEGGSLIGGIGGDEVFGLWDRRLADVAARRAAPRPADARRLAMAMVPRTARRALLRRIRPPAELPWLRPGAAAEIATMQLDDSVRTAVRWDRHVAAAPRHRSVTVALRDISRLAAAHDVAFHAPYAEPGFRASLARAGGRLGFGGRTATLQALFGQLLPPETLARGDKAVFNEVFFTERARGFARRWSGQGLDDELVDRRALRDTWLSPLGDYRSALLLQSAWLAEEGARS